MPRPEAASWRQRQRAEHTASKTLMCRNWFGAFVPAIRYPSLNEVVRELRAEVTDAYLRLAEIDQETLSTVFVQVVRAVAEESSLPVEDVTALMQRLNDNLDKLKDIAHDAQFPDTYAQLRTLVQRAAPATQEHTIRRILQVYVEATDRRRAATLDAFNRLRTFQESVNRFLDGKLFEIRWRATQKEQICAIVLPNGQSTNLSALSSGERHVLTLLFSATHMSPGEGLLLIDEPELSLHVDWQRIILMELMKQSGDRQVIACTHAPEVAADHRERLITPVNKQMTPQVVAA